MRSFVSMVFPCLSDVHSGLNLFVHLQTFLPQIVLLAELSRCLGGAFEISHHGLQPRKQGLDLLPLSLDPLRQLSVLRLGRFNLGIERGLHLFQVGSQVRLVKLIRAEGMRTVRTGRNTQLAEHEDRIKTQRAIGKK